MLGRGWVKVLPCAVAESGSMASDVDVVLDADAGAIEWARLRRLVVTARGNYDSATCTSLRSIEGDESM
jgi:hypothetical protein